MKPQPGSWQHDLVELLETLQRHDVPFLIAGGYAVAHAGHLRATKDLDIFVPRVGDASTRLARALSEFLGINELIRNKRAVGRHVDLADVEQLLRIRSERNV